MIRVRGSAPVVWRFIASLSGGSEKIVLSYSYSVHCHERSSLREPLYVDEDVRLLVRRRENELDDHPAGVDVGDDPPLSAFTLISSNVDMSIIIVLLSRQLYSGGSAGIVSPEE